MRTKSKYREIKSNIPPVEESAAENIPEMKLNGVEAEPVAAVSAEIPPQPEPDLEAIAKAANEAATADEAALALRKQLEQIRASEELQRQQAAVMMAAQRPLTREQKLEFWRQRGLSDEETRFLQANPEMIDHSAITNHAAAQALQAGHERDSEPYFAAVKTNFEEQMKRQQAQAAPKFFEPPPQKAPAARSPAHIVSAPVSREVPSGGYREPNLSQVRLSPEEVEIAAASGISQVEYAKHKLRLMREKASGQRQ